MDRKKILIIDDDKDFARMTKLGLEAGGEYEVAVETEGPKGYSAALKHSPGLILLDIMMPGTDGFDVLKALKKSSRTETIPVIMLTGVSDDQARIRAMKLYNEGYIVKPVDATALKTKIEEVLKLCPDKMPEKKQKRHALKEHASGAARVLVVDDEKSVCDLVEAFLTPQGFRVRTCWDPGTAVKLFTVEKPDIVILDLVMPGVDGMEILQEMKRRSQKTAIIILTGVNDPVVISDAVRLGADDIIVKPFSMDQLRASLIKCAGVIQKEDNP